MSRLLSQVYKCVPNCTIQLYHIAKSIALLLPPLRRLYDHALQTDAENGRLQSDLSARQRESDDLRSRWTAPPPSMADYGSNNAALVEILRTVRPRREGFPTSDSLHSALAQSVCTEFARLSASGHRPNRQGQATATETQFVLTELVELLAPASVLEIGTFFADTAHVVAEAMAELGEGHFTTIDPFGGHRVPGIIAGWHGKLRDRVTFRPDNSMAFFMYLDNELHAKRGDDAPFNIIYVDGNHTFEYAFFDLMCASLYLRPGGVFVVDNIDLGGPAGAIRTFLDRHTHWKLFKTGGAENDAESLALHPQTNSAMIVAPDGIEIGSLSYQLDLSSLQISQVHELEIRVRRGAAGLLCASTCLYSRPTDYHLTGEGEQARIGVAHHSIDSVTDDIIVITYEPPIAISPLPNDRIAAHVELSFAAAGRENLLVEADPVTLR